MMLLMVLAVDNTEEAFDLYDRSDDVEAEDSRRSEERNLAGEKRAVMV